MASPGFMYDHPQFTVRRPMMGEAIIAAGTATPGGYGRAYRAIKLHGAYIVSAIAGTVTSAAVRLVSISGTTTTTHGTYTVGTAAAHALTTCSFASAASIAAGGRMYAEHLLDATMSVRVIWEYREDPTEQPLL